MHQARDTGPMFRVEAGEMICIDNYRVLYGRDGHSDPLRKARSIWGWSTDAAASTSCSTTPVSCRCPRWRWSGSTSGVADAVAGLYQDYAIPADSFARSVEFAMSRPQEVDVNEILFRPTGQQR
ncbi:MULTISPECIES: hypothetical protein [unclassified Streptomyces]|uniref:hypothetical protein n=1 Tax=unclassified Streptomyces TaxID=2593676 RepID=UPI002E81B213|nr:hypothetical protein [Streptomyces sp. NBC_00589]WTI34611.1 hypothetical protein OIC96_06215 [Streptomyces sp. NBC_00775]WUB31717.1 hypothetical protein OHA51_43515 [Streptomyces sp. NBC_00589]